MNFATALAAADPAERDRLIAAEIAAHDWLDHVGRQMQRGGWPEVATPRVLGVEIGDASMCVSLAIAYTELCPQGCNAYPRRFERAATAQLRIDRVSGASTVEVAGDDL